MENDNKSESLIENETSKLKLHLDDLDKLEKLYVEKKKILEFAMDVQKIKEKRDEFYKIKERKVELFYGELLFDIQNLNNQACDKNKLYEVKIENLNQLKKFMQKKRDIIAHQFEILEYEEELYDKDFVMAVDNQFKFQLNLFDKHKKLIKLNIDLDIVMVENEN